METDLSFEDGEQYLLGHLMAVDMVLAALMSEIPVDMDARLHSKLRAALDVEQEAGNSDLPQAVVSARSQAVEGLLMRLPPLPAGG